MEAKYKRSLIREIRELELKIDAFQDCMENDIKNIIRLERILVNNQDALKRCNIGGY